jgi:DNA-binding NarL/FixJ family response regulator
MDLYMPSGPDAGGVKMVRQYKELYPDVLVVVLTMETTAAVIQEVIALGVGAVVSKRDRINLLYVAIVSTTEGDCYLGPTIRALLAEAALDSGLNHVRRVLSKREFEVLTHYATGLTLTEIASRVGRSVKTISAQKRTAMRKLSLQNEVELFSFAVKHFSTMDHGARNALEPSPKWPPSQASAVNRMANK